MEAQGDHTLVITLLQELGAEKTRSKLSNI
jgi:hypothetical protein